MNTPPTPRIHKTTGLHVLKYFAHSDPAMRKELHYREKLERMEVVRQRFQVEVATIKSMGAGVVPLEIWRLIAGFVMTAAMERKMRECRVCSADVLDVAGIVSPAIRSEAAA